MIDTNLLKIRKATRDDLPTIIKLMADDQLGSHREKYQDVLSQEYYTAFANIDSDNNNYLIVLEYNNIVIGTLQLIILQHLSHMGSKRGHIEQVRIDEKYRSQGLGEFMVKWAIDKSRELGCNMVQLTTNKQRTRAFEFYKRIGFTPSHEGLKYNL